jgi:predicted ester cyclase
MRDRKFVDHYPARHDVEMLQQLGLLPANFGPPRGGGGVRQGGAGTPATAAAVHAEVASPTATREELERNKAVVRAHLEKTNRGDVEGMLQDFADRDIRNNGRPVAGREYFRAALEDLFRAIPDWRVEIDELVAEGDTVAVRYRASGTHTGVTNYGMNMLPAGQPPTRKRFAGYRHIHIYKLRDGKLVDHYPARDDLGLLRQLGLLPAGFGKQTFPTR